MPGVARGTERVLCVGALYEATSQGRSTRLLKLVPVSARMPVLLVAQLIDAGVVLSWTNPVFVLQSAPDPSGPFVTVPNATSPYTNRPTFSRQFYRLAAD